MTSSQTNTRRSVYKVLLEFTVCRFYSLEQNPRGKVTPMASERSLTHRALIFPTSWRARATADGTHHHHRGKGGGVAGHALIA